MWPFNLFTKKENKFEKDQEELLALLRGQVATEKERLEQLNKQRKEREVLEEQAKLSQEKRKQESKKQRESAAAVHLQIIENYMQAIENPDVTKARRAQLNAIIETRKSRVESLGFTVRETLEGIAQQIQALQSGN